MIVRPRLHWLRMLFVWHGSVVPKILPRLLLLFVFASAIVGWHEHVDRVPLQIGAGPLSLLGVTLAIFLGFRNSTSYARFWEARTLWGSLLNVSRSFARQAFTLPSPPLSTAERRQVSERLTALALALVRELRFPEQADASDKHYPAAWHLRELGAWLGELRASGRVSEMIAASMDRNLDRVSDVIGGCERIATTPIPYVYSVLLHRTVYLYSLVLPFALVDGLRWSTPWIAVFIAYTLIALDSVTAELEDPFGTEPNDLALDAMARTIERSVLELAELEVPEAKRPNAHYCLS